MKQGLVLLLLVPVLTQAYFIGPGGWGRIGVLWSPPRSNQRRQNLASPSTSSTKLNDPGVILRPPVAMKSVSAMPKDLGEEVPQYMLELEGLERQVKTKFDEAVKEGLDEMETTAKAIDTSLRQGITEFEKGIKDSFNSINKAMHIDDAYAQLQQQSTAALAAEGKDWSTVRLGKILNLWSSGQMSTTEFTKATAARLNNKMQTAISSVTPKALVVPEADALKAQFMEGRWARRGAGSALFRTLEIWSYAFQFLTKELKVRKIKDLELQKEERMKVAVFCRESLLELGPTFIKFGQVLSTRIDILPKEYTEALSLLQDNVPGFSGEITKQIILKELGKPVEELFDTFDANPLAAASLGQVHRATKDGQQLAIKIQRQGLKDLFDLDLKNLRMLAVLLDKFDPKTDGASRDWVSIYEESAKLLYREIDYRLEGQNAERFAANFKGTPWVKVPKIYWNYTTETVLAMEYCPGIKISDIAKIEAAGIDRKLLAKRSAESYLTQLCRHGFFHCDPHPGNVACDNVAGGRLIYYDFGMMDEFQPNVKKGLVDLIFAVYENDPKAACDGLETMDILRRGADRVSVEKIARFFLNEFQKTMSGSQKWINQLDKNEQKRVVKNQRAQLGEDLLSVSSDLPFKFPPTFTFVFRAFTSLDGIGKGLDAQYDLTRLAGPYLKELIDLRDGSVTLSVIKEWQKKLGWRPQDIQALVTSPRKVAAIEDTLRRAEQGDLKLRVRVLESERAFQRMDLVQNTMGSAIMASLFLNAGILVTATNPPVNGAVRSLSLAAKTLLLTAALFGLQIPTNYLKLRQFDKRSEQLGIKRA